MEVAQAHNLNPYHGPNEPEQSLNVGTIKNKSS